MKQQTIPDIIQAAGGASAVAEALGLDRTAVVKWRHGGIPDRHWPLLMERARVTTETLFAANVAARSGKDAA